MTKEKQKAIERPMAKSTSGFKTWLWNVYASGLSADERESIELIWKVILGNIIFTLGLVILTIFGVSALIAGRQSLAILDLTTALIIILIYIFLRITHRFQEAYIVAIFVLGGLFAYLFFSGGAVNSGHIWLFTYPLFVLFALGRRLGTVVTLYFLMLILIGHFFPGLNRYSAEFISRFAMAYLLIFGIIYFFEYVRAKAQEKIAQKNEELEKIVQELQETERALRESEKKYRGLVELAKDGIVIIQNDKIKYANPQVSEILGYSAAELIGTPIHQRLPGCSREAISRRNQDRIAGHDLINHCETSVLTKAGQEIDVEINASTITFQQQPAVMVFIRDIRERKLLEAERLRSYKLEWLELLSEGIAHDFNNLLTVISGNITQAKKLNIENDKLEKKLEKVDKATSRAIRVIQQFLMFTKDIPPVTSVESIENIVHRAAGNIQWQSSHQIEMFFAENLWPALCDRQQVELAIENILTNACESMPKGGRIYIRAGNKEQSGEAIPELPPGAYIKTTIRDQGVGIPQEHLGKIFDPYFSTKTHVTQKGMGLGLAIVQSIMHKHKGSVRVSSEVGVGTTFELFLPADDKIRDSV